MRTAKSFIGLLALLSITACTLATRPILTTSPLPTASMIAQQLAATLTLPTIQTLPAEFTATVPEQDNLLMPTANPSPNVVSWEQIIAPDLVADVVWTLYSGQLEGKEKGSLRDFTLSDPSHWAVTANPNPVHFAVQNVPEMPGGGQTEGDFVKLEVVPVKGPLSEPMEGEEQVVQVDEQTAALWTNVTAPGQALRTSLTMEKDGVFYVLAGYVNLTKQDQAALDRYRMILLSMMSSFQIE